MKTFRKTQLISYILRFYVINNKQINRCFKLFKIIDNKSWVRTLKSGIKTSNYKTGLKSREAEPRKSDVFSAPHDFPKDFVETTLN